MKFTLSYEVECPTLDDVLKIIKEIDQEMGMIPVKVTDNEENKVLSDSL